MSLQRCGRNGTIGLGTVFRFRDTSNGRIQPTDRGPFGCRALKTDLVLRVLDITVWQQRPEEVIYHSGQGC